MLYPAEAHARPSRTRSGTRAACGRRSARSSPTLTRRTSPTHCGRRTNGTAGSAALPMKNLYVGAAGVAWALDRLRRRGHAETALDPADVAQPSTGGVPSRARLHDGRGFCSRSGSRRCSSVRRASAFVAWRLAPSDGLADALLALVRANVGNPANEIMWGVSGTLLAARVLLEATGDGRWCDAVRESEDVLRAARDADGLWTQVLYGRGSRGLGPPRRARRQRRGAGRDQETQPTSSRGLQSSKAAARTGRERWTRWRRTGVSSGATALPGSSCTQRSTSTRSAPFGRAARLGRGAARRREGRRHLPRHRRQRLCAPEDLRAHGRRALARAGARLAVHALEQAQRLPGRYSLFTGGVGAALFAADCLDARAVYPVFEDLI